MAEKNNCWWQTKVCWYKHIEEEEKTNYTSYKYNFKKQSLMLLNNSCQPKVIKIKYILHKLDT